MTKRWMDDNNCGFMEMQCYRCRKRTGVIWYNFYINKVGYLPLCEFCAEHLALGMLRDCVEVRAGRGRANAWYQQLQNDLNRLRNKAFDISLEAMNTADTKRLIAAMMEKPRCVSDKMLHKEMAREAGLSIKELNKRIDVSKIKLSGVGVQIVQINPPE